MRNKLKVRRSSSVASDVAIVNSRLPTRIIEPKLVSAAEFNELIPPKLVKTTNSQAVISYNAGSFHHAVVGWVILIPVALNLLCKQNRVVFS